MFSFKELAALSHSFRLSCLGRQFILGSSRASSVCQHRSLLHVQTHQHNNNLESCENENSFALQLYNTFKKKTEIVKLGDAESHVKVGLGTNLRFAATVYCCGPTVYDHCHLGHALTYVRFDLLRRVLSTYCNVDLIVGMGITDIDDKILAKAGPESQNSHERFTNVAQTFYESFREDMSALNVSPPHFYLRVTDHVQDIIDYVRRIEELGAAYINPVTDDVTFDTSRVASYAQMLSLDELQTTKSAGKKSPRDFALWKRAKPGEPSWDYISPTTGQVIPGRPGWHVECSALAHFVFGDSVDFHFGGKDLVFPHHYNESACCYAFQDVRSGPVHGWSKYWLHSGHLIFKHEKMSKSLGNVIPIKSFLQTASANVLRLFCIKVHYRSDFVYTDKLLEEARAHDAKLTQFVYLLHNELQEGSSGRPLEASSDFPSGPLLGAVLESAQQEVMKGIADDLDLNRGLRAILDLMPTFQSRPRRFNILDVARAKFLLERWLSAVGLDYQLANTLSVAGESSKQRHEADATIKTLQSVRDELRRLALGCLRQERAQSRPGASTAKTALPGDDTSSTKKEALEDVARVGDEEEVRLSDSLMRLSDKLRDELKLRGVVVVDSPQKRVIK